MKIKETKNEFGVDLVRVIAMFFVISLHYFLNSGYYDIEQKSTLTIYLMSFRSLFFQCVPIFLIITGYLKRNAKFEAKHYIKATPIIINSLIISAVVIAYKVIGYHEQWAFLTWAKSVWTFNQPGYGWYVNMYLSMFILMPFVNAGYNALDSKNKKLAAVLITVFATTFAVTINRIKCPDSMEGCIGMPLNYFSGLWPFAYYVVGMYIGEFKPKIPKITSFAIAAFFCMFIAVVNHLTMTTNCYSGFTVDNGDILNVIIATFVFLFFYDIKVENKYIRWIFAKISALSMCTYLLSYIFDCELYKRFGYLFTGEYPVLFKNYWIIVPLDFLLSVIVSIPVFYLGKFISKLIMKPLFKLADKKKIIQETIMKEELSQDENIDIIG